MNDVRTLTEAYVAAFDSCDLEAVASLMAGEFTLTDPEVTELAPKVAVLDYISNLFIANPQLSFKADTILVDGDMSAIEFSLELASGSLRGVDVIAWRAGKMISMRAHLTAQN